MNFAGTYDQSTRLDGRTLACESLCEDLKTRSCPLDCLTILTLEGVIQVLICSEDHMLIWRRLMKEKKDLVSQSTIVVHSVERLRAAIAAVSHAFFAEQVLTIRCARRSNVNGICEMWRFKDRPEWKTRVPCALLYHQSSCHNCQKSINPNHHRNIRHLIRNWIFAAFPRTSPLFRFFGHLHSIRDCKRNPYCQV